MFEMVALVLFCWLAFKVVGIALKLTWGAAKIIASILLAIALPALIACLLFASGIVLLIPVALIGIAFGILKACV